MLALIITKDESAQNDSRLRLKRRGWKTMTALPSAPAATIVEESHIDVVIIEQKEPHDDLSPIIASVRAVDSRIPIFVIAKDQEFIRANRPLLPGWTYLCQELDTQCIDHMIDCLGLSARLKLNS